MFDDINRKIYDNIKEGIIYIDEFEKIHLFNRAAMEIFGLVDKKDRSHSEGFLKNGDIVVIATNSLGSDDGNLNRKTLNLLGYNGEIKQGEPFVIVGKYADNTSKPIFYYGQHNGNSNEYRIEFDGIKFSIIINHFEKSIDIGVNGELYKLSYIYTICNMIIIDGDNKSVKFAQSKGYTARNESPREILEGSPYKGKGDFFKKENFIGRSIREIIDENITIDEFIMAAKGEKIEYSNQFAKLNNFPTLCSIKSIFTGNKKGAILIVEDVSNIERIMKEKDYALEKLYQLQRDIEKLEEFRDPIPEIIGKSKRIINIKKMAAKASKSNSNLLILGESGTGKTLLAKAIHSNSVRKDHPFIHVNCSSIPENLLESELFGYEGGSFTGAIKKGKKGMFELADKGTIFLDEIGDLDIILQAKILKVIQDKSFYRIGGNVEIKVDVRIISATNRDLENMVKTNLFRSDLYYRLNVLTIVMAPLREMKNDIELLAETLIPFVCKKAGVSEKRLSHSSILKLKEYSFPGNVRELENILERAANITYEEIITPDNIMFENDSQENSSQFKNLKSYVKETERKVILEALIFYEGDIFKVMDDLGIKKSSFYQKIKDYKIDLSK